MVMDAAGNLYVTGTSSGNATMSDYATVKLGPAGNPIWVARYNGPDSWLDEASDVAVDGAGNVYATGRSRADSTYYDYATVKYDPAGNELWAARYDGPGSAADAASSPAVDSAGNVYVTGNSEGDATGADYATVKYGQAGNELWVARHTGPLVSGQLTDEACCLALDAAGSVYVTGVSEGYGSGDDIVTIKYDTDGNELWLMRYDGPAGGTDAASSLAVDSTGNLYVTGKSQGVTGVDYVTIKYDTDGTELWATAYNGPDSLDDEAVALTVDPAGNVYVTGHSHRLGTWFDLTTVAYDPNGNELWSAHYNYFEDGWDGGIDIALDGSGNVYVTGKSDSFLAGKDYVTIKYASYGAQLWVMLYRGPRFGSEGDDEPCSLAVDAAGNVYVTGTSPGSVTGHDYTTIKYDENQPSVCAAAGPAEAAPVNHGPSKTTLLPNVLSFLILPIATILLLRLLFPARQRGRRPSS